MLWSSSFRGSHHGQIRYASEPVASELTRMLRALQEAHMQKLRRRFWRCEVVSSPGQFRVIVLRHVFGSLDAPGIPDSWQSLEPDPMRTSRKRKKAAVRGCSE